MIKLKGALDWELTRLGLEPGDVIKEHSTPSQNGAVYFDQYYNGFKQTCVVWPDNYEIIDNK
ncbi:MULTISPECIES: hypothetical protein [unclassified Dysgonomonas]|uniref:hypothetical protein n=1 Tax=unclassified Dysgonomonas TaxID=2630389 RepID=UPI0025C73A26|nr:MULTISPECIES: hypothetical protein [unclassified Dysgonomonas]HMM02037.1 hypothetical protein [Dysgonomonas sp.]